MVNVIACNRSIEDIRQDAELVLILAGRRAGEKANELAPAKHAGPGRGHKTPLPEKAGFCSSPTLVEMFGSRASRR
jgi:hypothetical protein